MGRQKERSMEKEIKVQEERKKENVRTDRNIGERVMQKYIKRIMKEIKNAKIN